MKVCLSLLQTSIQVRFQVIGTSFRGLSETTVAAQSLEDTLLISSETLVEAENE
jgi:hypothetical protein